MLAGEGNVKVGNTWLAAMACQATSDAARTVTYRRGTRRTSLGRFLVVALSGRSTAGNVGPSSRSFGVCHLPRADRHRTHPRWQWSPHTALGWRSRHAVPRAIIRAIRHASHRFPDWSLGVDLSPRPLCISGGSPDGRFFAPTNHALESEDRSPSREGRAVTATPELGVAHRR